MTNRHVREIKSLHVECRISNPGPPAEITGEADHRWRAQGERRPRRTSTGLPHPPQACPSVLVGGGDALGAGLQSRPLLPDEAGRKHVGLDSLDRLGVADPNALERLPKSSATGENVLEIAREASEVALRHAILAV